MTERRKIGTASRNDVRRQALAAAEAASSKKADDIVVLDVGEIIAITDFFVIVSGANDRQVRTIVEEVERRLAADFAIRPIRTEGLDDARWVLVDYGDFFVHVFHHETRAFYQLERLWSDAPRIPFEGGGADAAEAAGP